MFRTTLDSDKFFVVADLHKSHRNYCRGTSNWPDKEKSTRDFDTIEQMNECIDKSILDTVPEDADLFILGDIQFGDKKQLNPFIEKLRPRRLYYIFGNHCLWMRDKPEVLSLFDWVGDYLEVFVKRPNGSKQLCCMFHYPIKSFNDEGKGSYCLSGHSHLNLPYTENEKGLDVCWDLKRRPLSFSEIDSILSKRRFVPKDHHNEKTDSYANTRKK